MKNPIISAIIGALLLSLGLRILYGEGYVGDPNIEIKDVFFSVGIALMGGGIYFLGRGIRPLLGLIAALLLQRRR